MTVVYSSVIYDKIRRPTQTDKTGLCNKKLIQNTNNQIDPRRFLNFRKQLQTKERQPKLLFLTLFLY